MNKPKLVICDIDNTIVPKYHTLTPQAIHAIDFIRSHGTYFGVASGRPFYQIKECYDRWGYEDLDVSIGFNGSFLHDSLDDTTENFYVLKKEWIKEIIELVDGFYTNASVYRENHQLFLKNDLQAQVTKTAKIVDSIEELYKIDTAKIMFRVKEEMMPKLEEWIAQHPSEHYIGFKTQATLMEFCDRRINKAYALKKFCEKHNIQPEEVIAFGDTSNDNEMIDFAGLGVCMLNGSDDTKQIANQISDKVCDDDGWADFMIKYILPLYYDKKSKK